jgi:hypothetical protein
MRQKLKLVFLGIALISTAASASPVAHSYGSWWGNATVTADDCAGPSVDHEQVPWSFYQMIPCHAHI